MASFNYEANSTVAPDRVLAALTDFSDERLKVWPTLDPGTYKVHTVSETTADVTEGSPQMGGIWGREHYDWSTPGVVRLTLGDSNLAQPGGVWVFRVEPLASGGSRVAVHFERKFKGLKGIQAHLFLTLLGRQVFGVNLRKTLAILESREPAASDA